MTDSLPPDSQSKDENGLTPKQKRFVEEYCIDLNAKQSAIRAGYSEASAQEIGYQLLQKSSVRTAIAKQQEKISQRCGFTVERILQEYAKIAGFDITEVMQWGGDKRCKLTPSEQLERTVTGAIAEVEERFSKGEWVTKVKAHDKMKALEAIGKYIGMFSKDKEGQQEVSVTLNYKLPQKESP